MIKHQTVSGHLDQVFKKNHVALTSEVDNLHSTLHVFCHEGKAQFGKNLKRADEAIRRLQRHLTTVMAYEEKCLFPFINTHIPRLQPLIYLLRSEHEDFRRYLKSLVRLMTAFKKQKEISQQYQNMHQIREEGIYLVCLLRSHLGVETHNLYKTADKELHSGERHRLIQEIGKYS